MRLLLAEFTGDCLGKAYVKHGGTTQSPKLPLKMQIKLFESILA